MGDRRLIVMHEKMKPDGNPVYKFVHLSHPLDPTTKEKLPWEVILDGIHEDDVEEGKCDDKIIFSTDPDIHLEVPAKFEMCQTCEGRGVHVNPAIDGNGLTQEDFDNDPDFAEDYFSGSYDQTCNECNGLRVSPTLYTPSGDLINPRYAELIIIEEEEIQEDRSDRKTRWYESGCPEGPHDF